MSTPRLPTYVRTKIEERDRQRQTAFPAKVTGYSASDNTVKLEPQFIETWVLRNGERVQEDRENNFIENVPVCFPRHISWDISAGEFGLVICTKYSLDRWRNERNAIDPGDLRRFTMNGATFHPVLMDEVPSASQEPAVLGDSLKSALLDMFDNLTDNISLITATLIVHAAAETAYAITRTAFSADIDSAINSKTRIG